MPKVYEQQLSWQAANGPHMQYDKIQDMITPAMENAARAADEVQRGIMAMQDKRVAEAADALAQKQAEIIKNFDEFSLKDPQGEMVNRSMKEWDKFIAEMPYEARNRFERNNPKAREIFELKSKEAATTRARQYTTAVKKANVNRTAQDIITRGVTPEGIKALLQQEYDTAGKTMTPEDLIEYQQLLGSTTQQGAIKDAMSHGNLGYAQVLNDDKEFTVNLSPEKVATNREAINRLMEKDDDSGGTGSGSGGTKSKGGSLYSNMVLGMQSAGVPADTAGAAQRAIDVYETIAGGATKDALNRMGIDDDTVIAGGKTLKQIYDNMYPEARQKLMQEAAEAAMKMNTPAMEEAMAQVGNITELVVEADRASDAIKKQEATERADLLVSRLIENGGAKFIQLGDADGYKNVVKNAISAKHAREDQMNQTVASASVVYGTGRADLSSQYSRWSKELDPYEVMPLPHTPANEADAMIEGIKTMGKMSKADMIVPQKVDSRIADLRMQDYVTGDSGAAFFKNLEKSGEVPKGMYEQWNKEVNDTYKGITPMCLTNNVTFQEYADCLAKNGWTEPYSQTMEYDREKRNVTNLAAAGRILGRGSKDADYNEGTYAWALDVVDGLIINEVMKNEVYAEESGLRYTTVQMINDSALVARQDLRDAGKFDEYIDTSHFSDNGFDPFDPNNKPECAADIKQSSLYDFVNRRIVSLGGKADSPQAEKIAAFMRGAIKDRDIKMKADYNTEKEFKTVNPAKRGASGVIKQKTNKIVNPVNNATEEE